MNVSINIILYSTKCYENTFLYVSLPLYSQTAQI